jgi:predicted aspartyl protease
MKALLSLLLLGAAQATVPIPQTPPPAPAQAQPPADPGFALGFTPDDWQRMTVAVTISGKGPYRFVVDTGAERTVIARELAENLNLASSGTARVHSMTELSTIATVAIPTLMVGGKRVKDIRAPALEKRNLGAEGMLGVDSLQTQRVSFDFPRQVMTVVSARRIEEAWAADAIVVTGRSLFGHLVLVDASVDGEKVWVIIDTGAQATIGNSVLRRKLERRGHLGAMHSVEMLSVTGGRMVAEQALVQRFQVGGAFIRNMPVAFADAHPFKQLGLTDRPALLLGMDVLKLFDRVSVDFPNRRVRLLLPTRSDSVPPARMAGGRARQLS